MSWGFIPGSLASKIWEKQVTEGFVRFPIYREGQIGMNTSSESPTPYQQEPNAPAEKSALSSYEIEELFQLATTALRQATEAAWKVHAREALLATFRREAHTTQAPEAVSPFMQKVMLYCGLLALSVEELRSIVPIPRATAVTSSSRVQESSPSSPRKERFLSRSDDLEPISDIHDEPPIGSVVMDSADDVWQRDYNGWNCATSVARYTEYSWRRLTDEWTLRLIYRNDW